MSAEPRCDASLDGVRCDLPPDHDGAHGAELPGASISWSERPKGEVYWKGRSNYVDVAPSSGERTQLSDGSVPVRQLKTEPLPPV